MSTTRPQNLLPPAPGDSIALPPQSPTRYSWTITSREKMRQDSVDAGTSTTTPEAQGHDVEVNIDGGGKVCFNIDPPDVSDLTNTSIRDRAAHFLFRALVAQPANSVQTRILRVQLVTLYNAAFTKASEKAKAKANSNTSEGQKDVSSQLMYADEMVNLVPKLFRGTRLEGEFISGVNWKGCALPPEFNRPGVEGTAAPPQQLNGAKSTTDALATDFTQLSIQENMDDFDDHRLITLGLTPRMISKGRRLSHLPEPFRTKYWVKMFYQVQANCEISEPSLWKHYEHTFRPCNNDVNDNGHLDDTGLVKCITDLFKHSDVEVQECEVAPETFVIWGIQPRSKSLTYKKIMRSYDKELLRRATFRLGDMEERSQVVPFLRIGAPKTLNKFQEYVLCEPLLPLPFDKPGPVTMRLRRRAQGLPLGDTQPGFPGVRMKRIQTMYKEQVKEHEQQVKNAAKSSPAPETEPAAGRQNQSTRQASGSASQKARKTASSGSALPVQLQSPTAQHHELFQDSPELQNILSQYLAPTTPEQAAFMQNALDVIQGKSDVAILKDDPTMAPAMLAEAIKFVEIAKENIAASGGRLAKEIEEIVKEAQKEVLDSMNVSEDVKNGL